MTRRVHLVGAVIVGACLLASGTSAFAESADNDDPSKDNNAGVRFRQSCGGDNATEVGSVVPAQDDAPPESPTPDESEHQSAYTEYMTGQISYVPFPQDSGTDELGELPAAPAPTPIRGHHAVTG